MESESKKKDGAYDTFLTKTKEEVVKSARNEWNKLVESGDKIGRRCDSDLYTSIVYNFEVRKVYLDPSLNLVKLSHIVGTNTTYLSNVINKYFKCNLKNLINRYRVEYAKYLLDFEREPICQLPKKCGFTSRSVFYVAFKKVIGITPLQYVISENAEDKDEI
jgi:AraC-like DNA-binding protein